MHVAKNIPPGPESVFSFKSQKQLADFGRAGNIGDGTIWGEGVKRSLV